MTWRNIPRIDLTGKQFGEWKVLEYAGDSKWLCRCSCGTEKEVTGYSLQQGRSTECGHSRQYKLKGKQFGEWEVLDKVNGGWLCKCSCGVEKILNSTDLVYGKSKSCGHNIEDIIGKQFGEWEVLGKNPDGAGYLCKCSCGKIKAVDRGNLLRGLSKSCGHSKLKNISGKRFSDWLVLEYIGNGYYKCECSCGTIKSVSGKTLKSGSSKSCGCKQLVLYKKTMIDKYGDISSARLDNPRDMESITIIDSKEQLANFIISLGYKPTLDELGNKLGVQRNTVGLRIRQFELQELIKYNSGRSVYEIEIYNYINEIYAGEVITKNRSILSKCKELDIYIPELKIAIEFNGNYWHSEDYKEVNYHYNKAIECRNLGIQLITIFEYAWVNYKTSIKQYLKDILDDYNIDEYKISISDNTINVKSNNRNVFKANIKDNNMNISYVSNKALDSITNILDNVLTQLGSKCICIKYSMDLYNNIINYIEKSRIKNISYEQHYVWWIYNSTDIFYTADIKDNTTEKDLYEMGAVKIYNCGNETITYELEDYDG